MAFIPGLGDEQAAVNAIREILEGSPNMVRPPAGAGRTAGHAHGHCGRSESHRRPNHRHGFQHRQGRASPSPSSPAGFSPRLPSATGAAQALTQVGGNLPTAIDNGNVLMAIQALRTMNFARSLAEPNLTTLNGQPANFQAGGSFPIPTSVVTPGGAAQSVSYQNFGVVAAIRSLYYRPRSDPPATQCQRIDPQHRDHPGQRGQCAQPDHPTPVQHHRRTPRRPDTHRGGLDPEQFQRHSRSACRFWGDLPIIGRTGGIDNVTSGEQELVVLVTPVLVHPLDMCKTPPLPGNDIFEPGDVEFYLLGHLEGRRSEDYRASVRTDFARQERYIHCNDMFIIGPQGTTYGCCKSGSCPCPTPCPTPCPAASGNNSPPAPAAEVVQPPAAE